LTVATSHCSSGVAGVSMTRAPIDHFAMVLDRRSETIDPVKPTTAENTRSEPMFSPFAVRYRFTPRIDSVMDSTNITAMLVMRKSTIRFMAIA